VDQAYPFRGGYTYQNVLYAIAGYLVEKVSGIPWTTYIRKNIFIPLGMNETFPTLDASRDYPNRMIPHWRISDKILPISNMIIDRVAPAGAVWSSVYDMSKWMLFLLEKGKINGKPLINETTFNELFLPRLLIPKQDFYPTVELTQPTWTTYGLGWFQQDYKGKSLHFHTGSIDGDIAMLGLLPADSLGVFILGNLDHAELRHAILFEVLDLFGSGFTVDRDWNTDINLRYQHLADENRKERLPEIRMNDDKFPAAVSGHYHHPLYGQIQIEKTKDNLVMLHLTPLLTLNLTAVTETEYRGKYQDYFWFDEEKVVFELHPEHKQVLAVQIGQRKWIKEK
jgi:CubicO group peptidase (beta-lactamase class C family)